MHVLITEIALPNRSSFLAMGNLMLWNGPTKLQATVARWRPFNMKHSHADGSVVNKMESKDPHCESIC